MLAVSPNSSFAGFKYAIEELDIAGEHMRWAAGGGIRNWGSNRKLDGVATLVADPTPWNSNTRQNQTF